MKYKINKITSFSALENWQGLGKEVAEKLENGEAVEIDSPPKKLLDGGYLKEVSKPKGGAK
jgi:hypothetical protein|tara:strand:- start:1957 stop:2139 length:183 start_codon:yes stop_codon:yes gene_type:complete